MFEVFSVSRNLSRKIKVTTSLPRAGQTTEAKFSRKSSTEMTKWLELCSPDDTDSCSNHSHAGCSILWAAYLGGVAQWNLEVTFSDFLERDLSRFWSHPLAWRQNFWEICIPSIHEFSEQERLNAPYTEWVMISAKTSEQHATVDGHNPEPFGKYR